MGQVIPSSQVPIDLNGDSAKQISQDSTKPTRFLINGVDFLITIIYDFLREILDCNDSLKILEEKFWNVFI